MLALGSGPGTRNILLLSVNSVPLTVTPQPVSSELMVTRCSQNGPDLVWSRSCPAACQVPSIASSASRTYHGNRNFIGPFPHLHPRRDLLPRGAAFDLSSFAVATVHQPGSSQPHCGQRAGPASGSASRISRRTFVLMRPHGSSGDWRLTPL